MIRGDDDQSLVRPAWIETDLERVARVESEARIWRRLAQTAERAAENYKRVAAEASKRAADEQAAARRFGGNWLITVERLERLRLNGGEEPARVVERHPEQANASR